MKSLLTAIAIIMAPFLSQASEYRCASMAHAEQAVKQKHPIDPADGWVEALFGADEYQGGGQYVYRKIVVRVRSAHGSFYHDMIVSYSIVKSYDGPDHGDYCDLTAVEFKQDVCKARPQLDVCK